MTELGHGAYLCPGAGTVGKCIAACTVCALSSADQLAVQHVRPHQGMELEQGKPKDDSKGSLEESGSCHPSLNWHWAPFSILQPDSDIFLFNARLQNLM